MADSVFNDNMLYVNEKINETYYISINDNDTGDEEKQPMQIESVDNKSHSDEPEVQLIMEILIQYQICLNVLNPMIHHKFLLRKS